MAEVDSYAHCAACDTELAGVECDTCAARAWAAEPAQRAARMRAALHAYVDRIGELKLKH